MKKLTLGIIAAISLLATPVLARESPHSRATLGRYFTRFFGLDAHVSSLRRSLYEFNPIYRFLKRDMDVTEYQIRIVLRDPGTQRSTFRVQCTLVDYYTNEFMQLEDCEVLTAGGASLSREARQQLPRNLRVLGPNFYTMILDSELELEPRKTGLEQDSL